MAVLKIFELNLIRLDPDGRHLVSFNRAIEKIGRNEAPKFVQKICREEDKNDGPERDRTARLQEAYASKLSVTLPDFHSVGIPSYSYAPSAKRRVSLHNRVSARLLQASRNINEQY